MSNSKYSIVLVKNVTLIRSTDKAGLYQTEDGEEFWIPWSQLKDFSVDKDGDTGDIRIPRWMAEDKELDFEEEED